MRPTQAITHRFFGLCVHFFISVCGCLLSFSAQFEVFKMLAEGKSTQECAGMLNLSEKTILNCQTAVRKKLHVNTPAGLVHFAIRNGVIAQP